MHTWNPWTRRDLNTQPSYLKSDTLPLRHEILYNVFLEGMPSSDFVDCIIWNEDLVLWGTVPSDNAPSSARASTRQVRCMKISKSRARIAQSVEHQTFNLRVQGSSPCSGDTLMFTFLHSTVFLNMHFTWLSMTCSNCGQNTPRAKTA